MTDVIFIAVVVAFFVVALLAVAVCDRIATGPEADALVDDLLPPAGDNVFLS